MSALIRTIFRMLDSRRRVTKTVTPTDAARSLARLASAKASAGAIAHHDMVMTRVGELRAFLGLDTPEVRP